MGMSIERRLTRNHPSKTRQSVLAHRHRQLALRRLVKQDTPLHVADLARDLAELDPDVDTRSHDEVKSLATRLYHVHLPKPDEAGIISFDVETKIAAVTADTGR